MKRIAQKRKNIEMSGRCCYVGVDVHKVTYYVALLSEEGLRLEFSTPADPYGLLSKLNGLGVTGLAYPGIFWCARSKAPASPYKAITGEF